MQYSSSFRGVILLPDIIYLVRIATDRKPKCTPQLNWYSVWQKRKGKLDNEQVAQWCNSKNGLIAQTPQHRKKPKIIIVDDIARSFPVLRCHKFIANFIPTFYHCKPAVFFIFITSLNNRLFFHRFDAKASKMRFWLGQISIAFPKL